MTGPFKRLPPYFRSRENGSISQKDAYYREIAFNGTLKVNNQMTGSGLWYGSTQETRDVVTPGYRTIVAQGDIVNHPFHSKKVKRTTAYTGFQYRRNSGTSTTTQFAESDCWYLPPPGFGHESRPSGVPISALEREAGTQALANLNRVDIEGLVEAAEAHKARDIVRFRLNQYVRTLKRIGRKARSWDGVAGMSAAAVADVMAGNWARYRYGILPALYLVEDAIVGPKIRTLRDTARGRVTWASSGTQDYTSTGSFYSNTYTVTSIYEVEVKAGVLYRPDWNTNRFGLSIRQLPSAAYELTTASFVLDWFVNAGSYIAASTATVGVKKLATWTVVKETYSRTASITDATFVGSTSTYTNVRSPAGSNTLVVETTTRQPGITAGLTVRHGSIQNFLAGDKRTADAFALAWLATRRLLMSR